MQYTYLALLIASYPYISVPSFPPWQDRLLMILLWMLSVVHPSLKIIIVCIYISVPSFPPWQDHLLMILLWMLSVAHPSLKIIIVCIYISVPRFPPWQDHLLMILLWMLSVAHPSLKIVTLNRSYKYPPYNYCSRSGSKNCSHKI